MNTDSESNIMDRLAGSLLAGAIGDGRGRPYENITPPFDIDPNAPIQISDDTQLTIATCEAIIATQRVDPAAIAARFVDWFQQRRLRGIGASTYMALQELAACQHW